MAFGEAGVATNLAVSGGCSGALLSFASARGLAEIGPSLPIIPCELKKPRKQFVQEAVSRTFVAAGVRHPVRLREAWDCHKVCRFPLLQTVTV